MKPAVEIIAAIVLVIIFMALAASSATQKSATIDEFAHLPAGIYAWNTGDFSLYSKTPPLGRMLAAAPALLLKPQVETNLGRLQANAWRPWTYGSNFLKMNFGRYGKMLLASRLVVVFCGAVICILVWTMARSIYGKVGGLVALAACALSPTLIAHSRLVTTDVMATLFSLVFIFSLLKYVDKPTTPRILGVAAAAAFTLLVKFSGLLWVLLALASPFMVSLPGLTERKERQHILGSALHLALAGVLIWLLICAGYLAKEMGPHNELWFGSRAFRSAGPVLRLLPLPMNFLQGLDKQLHDAEKGEWSEGNYLLGKWYSKGKPYYYAVAVSAKEPLPHLLLFLAAVFLCLASWPWDRDEVVLLFIIVFWFAVSSLFGSLQIGIRYLLPIYPVAFILMGRVGWRAFVTEDKGPLEFQPKQGSREGEEEIELADTRRESATRLRRTLKTAFQVLLFFVIAWMLAVHVYTWPHYISFFNQVWGGPENGRYVLLDSNLDWGQDLPGLKKWMKENNVRAVDLAYFGHDDPARFAISYNLPGRKSDNRYIAISANFLMGKVYPMTFLSGSVYKDDPVWHEVKRYRTEEPIANAGHSILIYEKYRF